MSLQFSIAQEKFQGPLEVLLNLIEDKKLAVSDISLAEVTDGYLAYVEQLPEMPLGETAQFILVASTLLLIKSRALLPLMQLSEDERESVFELERRLARYAIIRNAAKILRKEWGTHPLLFARRWPDRPTIFHPGEVNVGMIAAAAQRLTNLLPKPEALAEAAVAPILALEEVIINVKRRLASALRTKFSELTQKAGKHERIVYFLAVLELVRGGSASVTQEKIFEEIEIELETIGAPKYG